MNAMVNKLEKSSTGYIFITISLAVLYYCLFMIKQLLDKAPFITRASIKIWAFGHIDVVMLVVMGSINLIFQPWTLEWS